MIPSKPNRALLLVSHYISIGLGMIFGNYLVSWLLQIMWNIKITNSTLLFALNLIPAFVLMASIIVLLRFSPIYKQNLGSVEQTLISHAGRRYIIESFLLGVVLIFAFRSCSLVIAWGFHLADW
jgi:hypothetical protein